MSQFDLSAWLLDNPLSESDVDCVVTVMLKIIDGKCKMRSDEKIIMAALYDAVKGCPGQRFGPALRDLIATARHGPDEELKMAVYEQRLFAETALSRPVMKAFKAMIRNRGLFAHQEESTDDEDFAS